MNLNPMKKKPVAVPEQDVRQEPKIILIAGSERSIYPFFLALSLQARGRSVLVIDNSVSQDLFSALPKLGETATINDIPVLRMRKYTPEAMAQFEYTIVYLGYMGLEKEYAAMADTAFIISDYTLISQKCVEEMIVPEQLSVRFIFDSKPSGRLSEDLIISKMKHYNAPADMEHYVLFVDERDMAGYLELLNSGYTMMKSMSKPFQKIISNMTSDAESAGKGQLPRRMEEDA